MSVGILALQGDVREHRSAFADIGVDTRPVTRPEDLDGIGGIVLPGGESTTLSLLLGSSGLFDPLAAAIQRGMAVFGTCAGLVLLATTILDGRPDQRTFRALECTVRRNGYGRQRSSFEALLDGSALDAALCDPGSHLRLGGPDAGGALPAVFIRAPRIVGLGPTVEVLARLATADPTGSDPVACRHGRILVSSFHPELTPDRRLHQLFAQMALQSPEGSPAAVR